MKQRKVPLRSCVVTREKYEKKELIRIVKTNENKVFVDLTGRLNGRGAYIKKDIDVLEKAKKSRILNRHLEIDVPNEIYDELMNIINSKN